MCETTRDQHVQVGHVPDLAFVKRLHDTGQAVGVRGTYVTCRHLICAGY